jgi:hypothetical protein
MRLVPRGSRISLRGDAMKLVLHGMVEVADAIRHVAGPILIPPVPEQVTQLLQLGEVPHSDYARRGRVLDTSTHIGHRRRRKPSPPQEKLRAYAPSHLDVLAAYLEQRAVIHAPKVYDGDLATKPAPLAGFASRFLRHEEGGPSLVDTQPLWWPAGKIVGRHLSPFLADHLGLAKSSQTALPDALPIEVAIDRPAWTPL